MLRWGPGYTGGEDPLNLLRDVIDAEEIRLDRWTVVFHPEDKQDDGVKPVNSTGKKRQKLSKMKVTNEQIKKTGQSICVYNNLYIRVHCRCCFAVNLTTAAAAAAHTEILNRKNKKFRKQHPVHYYRHKQSAHSHS